MRLDNPYHEGEIEVQRRVGVLDAGQRNGRVISDSILPGALKFIEQQSFVTLGSEDSEGALWTTVLIGEAGFIRASSDTMIEIDRTRIDSRAAATLASFSPGSRLGLLVIELASRRRLRINGVVDTNDSGLLRMTVQESYPNCPKYIQSRHLIIEQAETARSDVTEGNSLGQAELALIQSSDTFFVSSQHPDRGIDASHRGGKKGFVNVIDKQTLRIPDYPGNSMFNTLGNIMVHSKAGLTFVDFEKSQCLQLTGDATILWDEQGRAEETGGTQRLWDFRVSRWIGARFSFRVAWDFLSDSPFNI
ncbi:MAG: pyridoxamine 5'-phosphate oxidase family protein [Planctomycetota bacterium]|nr:pyridoxamine 5'-phosphate oxidase family protein [Planctomycetota bacterium]